MVNIVVCGFFPPSLSLFLSLCLSPSLSHFSFLSFSFFCAWTGRHVCDMPHSYVIHNTRIRMYIYIHIYMYVYMHMCTHNRTYVCLGRLRLVGSFKLQVSFAKEPYRRDKILQQRPFIFHTWTHQYVMTYLRRVYEDVILNACAHTCWRPCLWVACVSAVFFCVWYVVHRCVVCGVTNSTYQWVMDSTSQWVTTFTSQCVTRCAYQWVMESTSAM